MARQEKVEKGAKKGGSKGGGKGGSKSTGKNNTNPAAGMDNTEWILSGSRACTSSSSTTEWNFLSGSGGSVVVTGHQWPWSSWSWSAAILVILSPGMTVVCHPPGHHCHDWSLINVLAVLAISSFFSFSGWRIPGHPR